jgi:hypothetical protein
VFWSFDLFCAKDCGVYLPLHGTTKLINGALFFGALLENWLFGMFSRPTQAVISTKLPSGSATTLS